jgi:hypothetical protein
MSLVPFDTLPDEARVWVFAAADPLTEPNAARLLGAVDEYLEGWAAHGQPLTCARDWREEHFLAIGVDEASAGASGCSIDGLFRVLQRLQSSLGTSLVGSGRLFYRDHDGAVRTVDRADFARRFAAGELSYDTPVFDTAATTAGAYRAGFERPLASSWHAELR